MQRKSILFRHTFAKHTNSHPQGDNSYCIFYLDNSIPVPFNTRGTILFFECSAGVGTLKNRKLVHRVHTWKLQILLFTLQSMSQIKMERKSIERSTKNRLKLMNRNNLNGILFVLPTKNRLFIWLKYAQLSIKYTTCSAFNANCTSQLCTRLIFYNKWIFMCHK